MVEIKARLQLWKQNTQDALRGRMGPSRSRSSSDSSQTSGQSLDQQSADSFAGGHRDRAASQGSHKAPLLAPRQAELDRVAAFQNKTPSALTKMNAKYNYVDHRLIPAYIRSDALYKLGYTQSAKRSKEILNLLRQTGIVTSDRLMTRQNLNMDSLISLAGTWPHLQPLSHKEQQGLSVYVEGMQQNMEQLGKKLLDVPTAQRPYALFYANLAATPEDSKILMNTMQSHGVLDKNYKPANGGELFDRFKSAHIVSMVTNYNHLAPADYLISRTIDHAENLREALFPLPTYEAPKP